MKTHKDIDWEYEVDCLTQKFYGLKYNELDYHDTKDICEDEIIHYMENDDDTMVAVRKRVRYRIKTKLIYFRGSERELFHSDFDHFEWKLKRKHQTFYQCI